MTTPQGPSTPPPPRYEESVRAPVWVYLVLAAPLGIMLGVMTGVAIVGAIGGGEAVAFYIVMSLAALLNVLLLVNFTSLTVAVTDTGVVFAFGLFRKRFAFDRIRSVEASDYRWTQYGGWGIRFSFGGKRAWSVPGVKRGVLLKVNERGLERSYFVSSGRPDELAKAVSGGLSRS